MNLRYSMIQRRFEAEFSSDFEGDLSAVKTAGFKTDGPPLWVWHTDKVSILNKLREKRPASGLTITDEAFEAYKPLAEVEAKNAEVKAALAKIKKEHKREEIAKKQDTATVYPMPEGKQWISVEDLPPKPPFVSTIISNHIRPDLRCVVCGEPIYFYEQQDPPLCLWCETQGAKNSA